MVTNKSISRSEVAVISSLSVNLFFTLTGLAFFIPAVFSSPQWLTGTIINALLFIAASKLDFKRQLPVIILPSLGAFSHGVIFGPLTVSLLYFIPFIWLGNAVLVGFMGIKRISRWPFFFRVLAASALKSVILFSVASLYVNFDLTPALFLTAMGLIQFLTAMAGGTIAYLILQKI